MAKNMPMYAPELLKDLDLSVSPAKFNPPLSVGNPGEGLVLRPLELNDYEKGFLQLLAQLTSVGDISREAWEERFNDMKAANNTYLVTVIEDTLLKKVIGAASLVIEKKFIHENGKVGRVEDVVVSNDYRGKQLGKLLVGVLHPLAKKMGCYKLTLNCNDSMLKYYNGIGYKAEEGNANFLCIRI